MRIKHALALGPVVALAVGLRLYRQGDQGLFLDEAWSWAVSQLPLGDLLRMSLYDRPPPLLLPCPQGMASGRSRANWA